MASVRVCLLIIFCPWAKALSIINIFIQTYIVGEWASKSVQSGIQKPFLVELHLNIFSILKCCFVEFSSSIIIFYRRNCSSIITKGSKAIAKNLYQQKQMKGSNFKKEKNSPKPNSFFQNWTADFCDLQDAQTYIWSSISSCLPLSTPGHNSSQFHQFFLSNILDSE